MKDIIKFGEDVPGYDIPVLNEREIRAAAGIMFLLIYTGLMLIIFNGDFRFVKYVVIVFFVDFLIRVFINPRFSPTLIVGRLIVRNQVPEYVGARQKKFAWMVGVGLSAAMVVILIIINASGPPAALGCLACLIFLFFESVFGICLACLVYRAVYGEKAQYCPGEVCDVKSRQPIQRTSRGQLAIVAAFIVGIYFMVQLLAPVVSVKPHNLLGPRTTSTQK